jgi:hypothetical protein
MILVLSRQVSAPRSGGRMKDSLNSIVSSRLPIAGLSRSAPTISLRRMNIARGRCPLAFPLGSAAHCSEGSRHRRVYRCRVQSHDPACDCARARVLPFIRSNARRGITDIKDNVGSRLGQGCRDFRKLIIALVCWDGGSGCCYTERCAKQNRTRRLNGFAA